jgi:UDP-N-acetylmuramoyl-L-alanyl-D-glutamate--2,6-diaminopimelate ligase
MAMLAVNALYQDTSIEELCKKIPKIKAPLGRLQRVDESNVFIDYAHAPKPLEECLQLLRTLYDNIIVVFGCGGDRDKKKRPIMFEIAKRLANTVIITSDNPRNEKPIDIINDILCIEKNNKKNPLASDEFVINEIKKIDLYYSKLINYNEEGAKNLIVKEDRGDAIAVAVKIYKDSDIDNTAVLIAGKGHENYQIVGNEIKHFDDYEEAVKYLKKS